MTDNARGKMMPCEYVDDAGLSWRVDLTESVKTAGWFSAAARGTSYLPKHAKMRHVGVIETDTGKRHSVPIGNIGCAQYQSGGTISLDGKACSVTGRIGEKFRVQ